MVGGMTTTRRATAGGAALLALLVASPAALASTTPALHTIQGVATSGHAQGAAFSIEVKLPAGWKLERVQQPSLRTSDVYTFRLVHGRTRLFVEPIDRDPDVEHWTAKGFTAAAPPGTRTVISEHRVELLDSHKRVRAALVDARAPWPLIFGVSVERGLPSASVVQEALASAAHTLKLHWQGPDLHHLPQDADAQAVLDRMHAAITAKDFERVTIETNGIGLGGLRVEAIISARYDAVYDSNGVLQSVDLGADSWTRSEDRGGCYVHDTSSTGTDESGPSDPSSFSSLAPLEHGAGTSTVVETVWSEGTSSALRVTVDDATGLPVSIAIGPLTETFDWATPVTQVATPPQPVCAS
jgi:hypothetical protein